MRNGQAVGFTRENTAEHRRNPVERISTISLGLLTLSTGILFERKTRKAEQTPIIVGEQNQQPGDAVTTLVRSAQDGDERAFIDLVRRYEQTVYNFAFKVCRDKERAAETLQDTFVNLYRKLDQFDHKSKFTTWLYSIVANNCRMKHRRTKLDEAAISFEELSTQYEHRTRRDTEQMVPSWRSTPLHSVMNAELHELLDAAIEKLPVDYRVVFVLRDIEGQSAEETAAILKLSVPAVKSRLHRARVFLREQLNEYMTS